MSTNGNLNGRELTKDVPGTSPDINVNNISSTTFNESNSPLIKAPTKQDASHYKMDNQKRGLAIIFNHENFKVKNESIKSRTKTDEDSENMKKILELFGFIVQECKDYTLKGIKMKLQEVAEENHTDYDCLVVCVLSYGSLGKLYAYDDIYQVDTVWSHFKSNKCPTLSGKPKLFFIQACEKKTEFVVQSMFRKQTEPDSSLRKKTFRLPNQADFLITYSTSDPYFLNESIDESVYIKTLCKVLNQFGTQYDLLTLLTAVFRYIQEEYECNTDHIEKRLRDKETSYVTSMLTRLVKFPVKKAAKSDIKN